MVRSFERSIQISPVNRERSGVSKPEDFIIKFTPALELSNMFHEIAMNKVNLTYLWHNISSFYKNKTIKYTPDSGSTWEKLIFQDGNYSYDDLNDVIKQTLENDGHGHATDEKRVILKFHSLNHNRKFSLVSVLKSVGLERIKVWRVNWF